jgi:hypothetical protein
MMHVLALRQLRLALATATPSRVNTASMRSRRCGVSHRTDASGKTSPA